MTRKKIAKRFEGRNTRNKMFHNVNNSVEIAGELEASLTYNHEAYGEKFFSGRIMVRRNSGIVDFVPILVSELLIQDTQKKHISIEAGSCLVIKGKIRTYGKTEEYGSKFFELWVLVDQIIEWNFEVETNNEVLLEGVIFKRPSFRITPMNHKMISDVFVKVECGYGKFSIIRCITWGVAACYTRELEVGSRVSIYGRLQSRGNYAYEVSVSQLIEFCDIIKGK